MNFKKTKKLAALLLAAFIIFTNFESSHTLIQAAQTSSESAFAPARAAFAKLLKDNALYGVLTNNSELPIYLKASSQTAIINTLPSGSQVSLTDAVWDGQTLWFCINFAVNDRPYDGYIQSEYVVSEDERLAEWESRYLQNNMMSFGRGASQSADRQASFFPKSYRALIRKLAQAHPNWRFVPMDTGLNWNDVVKAEMTPSRNLVQTSQPDSWKSKKPGDYNAATGTWSIKSGTDWVQASEPIVKYFLDPRNFLTEESVFQFEQLVYGSYHKKAGVEKILNGTFMSHKKLEDGSGGKITYAQAFMKIGKSLKVSPYFLASRVRQEQGVNGTSPLISGNYPGYKGYYNYFNRRASGVGEEVFRRGLEEAKANGWNTRYKALKGGAKSTASDFIYKGQDTFYLQKFDVDASYNGLYWHQYMQNLSAADTEGKNVQKSYSEMGILNNRFVFKIPVYNNMPASPCPKPKEGASKPSLSLKKSSSAAVKLSWDRNTAADGYCIYRSTSKSGSYKKVKTISKNNIVTWSDKKIKGGKTYYYKMRSYVKASTGNTYSGYSKVLRVKVPKK